MKPDEALKITLARQDLSRADTENLFGDLMDGGWNDVQKTALLISLAMKGEAASEIAGAAAAMRGRVVRIPHHRDDVVDTCGTGGDGKGTFNISTAAALLEGHLDVGEDRLRLQEMLSKTIVFITHDFDEALRLADRIAIMKDGEVEQCDTPDRIVLDPATEYVAKFTEDIDKAHVVHAGALAKPLNGTPPDGEPVPAGDTIRHLARQLVNDPREQIPVADAEGGLIGAMSRQAALDMLLGDY